MKNEVTTPKEEGALVSKIKENYKIVTVALSLAIIVLSITNIALNIHFNSQTPTLQVGRFPLDVTKTSYEFTSEDIIPLNETVHQVNISAAEKYVVVNFSCMIYNSGKGSAYGVNAKLIGEPTDVCEVMSADVYVGEPIQSNFLRTIHDEYRIGLLGAGKAYTITSCVKFYLNIEQTQRFILTVTSENFPTIIYNFQIQQ